MFRNWVCYQIKPLVPWSFGEQFGGVAHSGSDNRDQLRNPALNQIFLTEADRFI
jgi:hypothetical protein